MTVEWKKRIAIAAMVRQRINELDHSRLWPFHLPELAAKDDTLREVETKLGYALNRGYRDFLGCANGWQCFYQRVDLFGTGDLLGSTRMTNALSLLDWIEPDVLHSAGVSQDSLLPIAASFDDFTLFCISKPGSPSEGEVLWFSGKLVERFANFEIFFLAMIDYNRIEVNTLTNGDKNDLAAD